MDFKISLCAARVNANMKQSDVAKAIGVSARSVCNWENGKTYPSGAVLIQLCNLYGIPLDNIILPRKSD